MKIDAQHQRRWAGLLIALLASVCLTPTFGQDGTPTVLARVGDRTVTGVDIAIIAEKTIEQVTQLSEEQRSDYLLQTAIDLNLMALAAKERGLDAGDLFKRRLALEESRLLQEAYAQQVVAEATTEEALQAQYDAYRDQFVPEEERRFSHILASSQESAEEAVGRVAAGENFATVAREISIDPAAQENVDIGFVTKTKLVAPLAEAGFALAGPGTVSPPVATEYGWHVLQLEESRQSGPDTFQESRERLRALLAQEALRSDLVALAEKYEVELRDPASGTMSPNP